MTRRIALAILLTVWATLIVGSVITYFTTRSILLSYLDATLEARAAALPQVGGGEGLTPGPDDRYLVQNDMGQTLARPTSRPAARVTLHRKDATFIEAEGRRMRRITLVANMPTLPESSAAALTIIYSGPADWFDQLMNRLLLALCGFGVVGGVAAAIAALWISRASLRPLRGIAQSIGTIDEQQLDRRIEQERLPPELAPVAERLNGLLQRLEMAFEQRKQFLADASHELRTPVAALMTTLEIALRRPREPQELLETLRRCLGDAKLLKNLVVALMEHARSDSPAWNEEAQEVDVRALAEECAATVEPLAGERGVRVVRRLDGEVRISSQAGRLRNVVMNLLSNAVEHNRPEGTVEISCRSVEEGVEVEVRDTGPGIAQEHLPHLFEPFYRVDKSRTRAGEHLGLGLFQVQSHVKALDGECRVRSELGVGSVFTVFIRTKAVRTENSTKDALAATSHQFLMRTEQTHRLE